MTQEILLAKYATFGGKGSFAADRKTLTSEHRPPDYGSCVKNHAYLILNKTFESMFQFSLQML